MQQILPDGAGRAVTGTGVGHTRRGRDPVRGARNHFAGQWERSGEQGCANIRRVCGKAKMDKNSSHSEITTDRLPGLCAPRAPVRLRADTGEAQTGAPHLAAACEAVGCWRQ